MEISMLVEFRILQKINGKYIPISNKEAKAVSIGGFGFEINGAEIPFDWDAFTGTECNKVFQFQTGKGFLFNDYEISDCYDESFEEIGIAKEDITAEFLASVTHIDEFFVDFEDANENEQALGVCGQNGDDEEEYRIKILEMKFIDMETDSEYYVKQNVLEDYNKGI